DLLDQLRRLHRLGSEFHLSRFNLGEVKHVANETQQMARAGGMSPRLCLYWVEFGGMCPEESNLVKPMMPVSGVRNSGDILATKVDLSLEASMASSRAFASSTWACLRSEMSRMALETSRPSSVLSGLKLISTANSLPSFRLPNSSRPLPIDRTRGSLK